MLTLSETHRKNAQEKDKNERDHIRQVHAERRSRYTTAVGQLSSEKATIRLGGVYTLVGLIDEWLTDSVLSPEELQKEGQVIVNNLCAYIRSPYPLAIKTKELQADTEPDYYTGDFVMDQAALHEEQDVRRAIFDEMSKRSSTFTENKDGEVTVIPGTWSDFDFDFSRAVVFYPLDGLTIENANFSAARFCSGSDFSGAAFVGTADFSRATFGEITGFGDATFTGDANFTHATFTQNADFGGASFVQSAHFDGVKFMQKAHFGGVKFTQDTTFSGAAFIQNASFGGANFAQNADFSWAIFAQNAHFIGAVFSQVADFNGATFTQDARFSETAFAQVACFKWVTFTQTADFSGAAFDQGADFSEATFESDGEFAGATFMGVADFCDVSFVKSPPVFAIEDADSGEMRRARFIALSTASESTGQEAHNFTVYEDSQPIPLGTAGLNGVGYRIPVGTVLFDPASWDERQKEHTRMSEPAQ